MRSTLNNRRCEAAAQNSTLVYIHNKQSRSDSDEKKTPGRRNERKSDSKENSTVRDFSSVHYRVMELVGCGRATGFTMTEAVLGKVIEIFTKMMREIKALCVLEASRSRPAMSPAPHWMCLLGTQTIMVRIINHYGSYRKTTDKRREAAWGSSPFPSINRSSSGRVKEGLLEDAWELFVLQ